MDGIDVTFKSCVLAKGPCAASHAALEWAGMLLEVPTILTVSTTGWRARNAEQLTSVTAWKRLPGTPGTGRDLKEPSFVVNGGQIAVADFGGHSRA